MANADKRGGLRLYHPMSSPQPLEQVVIPAADGNKIYIGDGVINLATGSSSVNGGKVCRNVGKCTAGGKIDGVVECFLPQLSANADISLMYRPASTAMYAMVRPTQPQDVWCIQASGSTVQADVGLNGDLTLATAGSDATGLSGMEWDSAAQDTTATRQLKCIGFVPTSDNDTTAAGAMLLVTINNADRSGGTGTAGI